MNDQEEDKLVQDFENGKTAYSLKEKLLKDTAIIQMKADLMQKFETTGFKEDDERREIWRKQQVIAWFDDILTQIINNGTIAEAELKGFAKLKQKFMR